MLFAHFLTVVIRFHDGFEERLAVLRKAKQQQIFLYILK